MGRTKASLAAVAAGGETSSFALSSNVMAGASRSVAWPRLLPGTSVSKTIPAARTDRWGAASMDTDNIPGAPRWVSRSRSVIGARPPAAHCGAM